MELHPIEWNVVILGKWNRSILTPKGIAKRLFRLDEGVNVEVLLALDEFGRYQVRHGKCGVEATRDALTIQPLEFTLDCLQEAKTVGVNALTGLPETPVFAVGINFKYRASKSGNLVEHLLSGRVDRWLSDDEMTIRDRATRRSVEFGAGVLNIDIANLSADDSAIVLMNFEKTSVDSNDLADWLRKPIAEFDNCINKFLKHFSEVTVEK